MNDMVYWIGYFRALALGIFLGWVIPTSAQTTNVLFTPSPDWVQETAWHSTINWTRNEKSEGLRYLLYEFQERPQKSMEFVRTVLLMENETGVQDCGSLRFSFDPNFQTLQLHRVVIHRGSNVLNRLDPAKIRVIQPEPDLNGHILTGRQTAVAFVEDLRVGDILEYAYSLEGANPILAGHYASRFSIQSGTPIERQTFRVIWDGQQPLFQRMHLTTADPVVRSTATSTEYLWHYTNLPAIPYEDYQPASFEPYPYIELSDFATWGRVVDWALPLYDFKATDLSEELRALIANWNTTASSTEEKARLALQFVQDELRYTGIELGPDSYRPTAPLETFQKRFGDCKGKVALLRMILQELGITSFPALVNTYGREVIARRLPSPFAFNHVILQIQLEGQTVWVDPTASHQGGTLWERYLPPYGKSLVLQPGTDALSDIPRAPANVSSQQKSFATFTLKDYEAPVAFVVRTEYRGASADSMREQIARTDPAELIQNYLNYYARFYASIKTNQSLQISDDRRQNLVTIEESYWVTNFWELDPEDKLTKAFFYADNLYNSLPDPTTRLRQTPLNFAYPFQRQQEITVHLPDSGWNISDQELSIEHEAFTFQYRRQYADTDRTLRLYYECQTRLAELPVELVPSYLKKLDEMEDQLADTLQRSEAANDNFIADLNWLMVVVALFGLGSISIANLWYWRVARAPAVAPPHAIPPLLPSPEELRLKGLAGWLLLVGFGLCLSPVVRAVVMIKNWDGYFSIHVWQSVAMPQGELFHPLYGPLLIFELLGNTLFFGIEALLLWQFFSHRKAFPKFYIAYLIANAVFICLDDLGCAQIPSLREESSSIESYKDTTRAIFQALIWSAYMLKSRRVRVTFIK